MPGLIKGPGLSLTSGLAYYNSVGMWSGGPGLINPNSVDKFGAYFTTGRYWLNGIEYASITSVPGWTFSRPGYNAIPRSVVTGAVAGTPGTDPANWQISVNANGLTKSIIGSGTDSNGFAYVDVRFSGTPTNSNSAEIIPQQNTNVAASNGQTWTGSMYVAIVGGTTTNTVPVVNVQELNGAGATLATTIGSAISLTSISTRAATTRTNNNASTAYERVVFSLGVTTGQAVDITLRIAAPQIELGSIAGPYQATTGTAVTSGVNTTYAETTNGTLVPFGPNQPRITDRGLLVEEARTNLLTYSQDFVNAAWVKNSASVTANYGVAPDGSNTATRLVASGVGGIRWNSVPLTVGNAYTWSIYVKSNTGTAQTFAFFVNGADRAVGVPASGWARVSFSAVLSSLNFVFDFYRLSGTGDVQIWGAQVELGPFPTSPIPTTTAAATRAADNASVTGLGGILAAPVTLVAWAQLSAAADGTTRTLFTISDGTNANRVTLARDTSNNLNLVPVVSGVAGTSATLSGFSGTSIIKSASRVTAVATRLAANNTLNAFNTANAAPTVNQLQLGAREGAGASFNGYLQRVQILGDTSDDQLRLLTV